MATKKSKYRSDTTDGLLPSFKPLVLKVIELQEADGHVAVLFDGVRTKAEAARNFKKGTGVADSIHCYGAAADVICGEHGWSCAAHGCSFFKDLQRNVESLGLLSGATFSKVDRPHFQGVSLKQQAALRKLGVGEGSEEKRDLLVRKFLKLS